MFADLTNEGTTVDTGLDNVVIKQDFEQLQGGRTLDVTGFNPKTIRAGHVIIKETSTGNYKPMPVTGEPYTDGTAYDALPAGHTVFGVLRASVLTRKPFAAIIVRGAVNPEAAPYAYTSAQKTALPLITFIAD